jgi:hypothetical protein
VCVTVAAFCGQARLGSWGGGGVYKIKSCFVVVDLGRKLYLVHDGEGSRRVSRRASRRVGE